ncbi:hypothetical protein [Legionella sainthelensi]|uniref:hypothetical protein n=1 Tax=Legionella sainthelensi TaxID=28087 RepID=UPI0015F2B5AC|nr:hypothetical protein [Legionella sainthelensi]
MSPEQLKAIQTRYSCAEQIILVDTEDNNRNLNPTRSRADANLYVNLGFKASAPSLFHTASFFVAKHKEKLQLLAPRFEQMLHPRFREEIKRFGG